MKAKMSTKNGCKGQIYDGLISKLDCNMIFYFCAKFGACINTLHNFQLNHCTNVAVKHMQHEAMLFTRWLATLWDLQIVYSNENSQACINAILGIKKSYGS